MQQTKRALQTLTTRRLPMRSGRKRLAQAGVVAAAALFLYLGVSRGEPAIVLNKASNICLECVGLG